jgi:hypothetical protein
VVITAKEGDHWGGLPYVGIDDNATYTTARQTFSALDTEVKRRLVAAKHNRLTADWMTIVVDDFSTLVKEARLPLMWSSWSRGSGAAYRYGWSC